jgi:chorismate dehydratase
MLQIGCVKYLNARPLIRGWPGDVTFDHPSVLCRKLAEAELDVALVSSFEFLRNPIYRIVDDVSISSDGPVYSVVVVHRGDMAKVRQIALDPASVAAVNLLHTLVRELGLNCQFVSAKKASEAAVSANLPDTQAHLLIGDQAIRFRQNCGNEFQFWDLGEAWKKLVAVPFTYALWLFRPEFGDSKTVASQLRGLRDENLADLDQLIAEEKDFDPKFCSRYYREHLQFSFGEKEKEGLRIFDRLCVKHGLLPEHDVAFRLA